jgi:superfamily II DNA or RNA helicase
MTTTLRPYQTAVVRETSSHYQQGILGVLLQMATGAGKTRTAAYIVEKYTSTGRQVLWLVHREELLMQAALVFAEQGIRHCLVCSTSSERAIKAQEFREFGRSYIEHGAKVVIASIQTIVRRLDMADWLQPSQIVADECHLSLAVSWRKVLGHWPRARLLGLTATPTRLDRQSFSRADGGLYDVMVQGPTVAELIDWGNLAQYDAYRPNVQLLEGVADLSKIKGGDYDAHELEKELDAPRIYGDVVAHYREHSHGKPAIAFCPTVASAEKFAEAFRAAGYRAIALDGQTDDAVRRQSLLKLGTGEIDVVTSVSILVEGTDVPFATTAILLRKTQSLALYLQAVGRVLRPHPDKPKAIILDCVGVIGMHGLPHWDREWSLAPQDKKRKRAANDNLPEVPVTVCPMCHRYHEPAPVCPHCEHVYPVKARREMEQVDGSLVKVTAEDEEIMRRQRRIMQGQAKSVADLVAQGVSRGRAMKIVAAREAKQALVEAVMAGLDAERARTGRNCFDAFGVTLAQIRVMKPAELKSLRDRMIMPMRVAA